MAGDDFMVSSSKNVHMATVSHLFGGWIEQTYLWLTSHFPPLLGTIHTTLHVRAYHRLQCIDVWPVPIQSSFINSNHKPLLSSVNESSKYQPCISSPATTDVEFDGVYDYTIVYKTGPQKWYYQLLELFSLSDIPWDFGVPMQPQWWSITIEHQLQTGHSELAALTSRYFPKLYPRFVQELVKGDNTPFW